MNLVRLKQLDKGTFSFAIGLFGTLEEHSKNYEVVYLEYQKKYPDALIFPIYIGALPKEMEEDNNIFKFESTDINPSFLAYMFSNFDIPVLFIGVGSIPSKLSLSKSLINSNVNISYKRRFIYSLSKNTMSYVEDKEKIEVAIIDKNNPGSFISKLPENIMFTGQLKRLFAMDLDGKSPEKFEMKRCVENLNDIGFFFEKLKKQD